MDTRDWLIWACILYLQQSTFLFSSRAKNSGSLRYSALAGIGSHGSWFFANLYFVRTIFQFKDAPFTTQLLVCLFYMTFTIAGTVSAQWVALKWGERGSMRVGAR